MKKIELITSLITDKYEKDFATFIKLVNTLNKNEKGILAREVIKTNNSEYIYEFAKDVKDAPVSELATALIATGKKIFEFARDVKNAPIDILANAVILSGKKENIYLFARDVKDAPIDKLAEAMIKTNDSEYIYYFARDVKNAPIGKLEDAFIKICYYNCYVVNFATETKGANTIKLANCLISNKGGFGFSQWGSSVIKFARDVKDAPIDKLEDAVINAKFTDYKSDKLGIIYTFAMQVKYANIEKLATALMECSDYYEYNYFVYLFARDVKNAPIDRLANALIDKISKYDDASYIYEFARDVKNAPIDRLYNKVKSLGNERYIRMFEENILNKYSKEREKLKKLKEYIENGQIDMVNATLNEVEHDNVLKRIFNKFSK